MMSKRAVSLDQIVIRPGECQILEGASSRLVSYDIGSCIVVTVHAPEKNVAGFLRFALPDTKFRTAETQEEEWMFADQALPRFFARLRELGLKHEELSVRITGGAFLPEEPGNHAISRKNQLALRSALWREGIVPDGEDLGGAVMRSVWFETTGGRLIVRSGTRLPAGDSKSGKGIGSCHLAS